MSPDRGRIDIQSIPLIEEKHGQSLLASIGIHCLAVLMVFFGGYLLPQTGVQIIGGRGGGAGGDLTTVGVVEDLSGGAGMIKPSLVPKPPALLSEPQPDKVRAVPLPGTVEPKKKKPEAKAASKAPKQTLDSSIIPTAPEPGSGGIAKRSGGSGGGIGTGSGVSIGAGSGGFGDSYYPGRVEARISSNWIRPAEGVHVEMVYSFYIAANGTIYGIKQEKSSGNPQMDLTAERAILASNPLSPPPQEFRGRPIKFVAQFLYPPNP